MFNLFRWRNKYQHNQAFALQLIKLINRVKVNMLDNTDMTYSYYETSSELIQILDKCISEIEQGNLKVIDDLAIELAPTSSLQEHSISNEWSNEYLIIAEEFDSILRLAKK